MHSFILTGDIGGLPELDLYGSLSCFGDLAGVGFLLGFGVSEGFLGGRRGMCIGVALVFFFFFKSNLSTELFCPFFSPPSKNKLMDNTMGSSFTCVMYLKNMF